ncbi:MAG: BON domain-containing protein [Blastocatellia bacterium]
MRIIDYALSVALCIGIAGCASPPKVVEERVDDTAITSRVRTRLANDATLHLFRINVDTRQGIVTLSGILPSEDRKRRAGELAAEVSGVRQVENLLQVGQTRRIDRFEDAVITSRITSRLIQDPLTHTLAIDVESQKGTVILTGRVQSEQEKKEAERIARSTTGVVAVENQLEILE